MLPRLPKLKHEFSWAGFSWPMHVWTLPKGSLARRAEERRKLGAGEYYRRPKPIEKGPHPGTSFYLDSDFMPGLRWQWCDKVYERINHTGWFTDQYEGDKIRGIVMRLPSGRGFLAGWSMGEDMISEIDGAIYDDEIEAARSADDMARRAAEDQREYEENEQ